MIFVDWFLQKKQWLKMYDAWKCSLVHDVKVFAFRIWCQYMNDDISCEWLFKIKSMFSYFKHKGSKHYCRDQDLEMYECMMKNLSCSAFWKFLLESIVLFSIIKLIVVEICRMKINLFWNGVMIARDSWQGVQTLVAMFSKRKTSCWNFDRMLKPQLNKEKNKM